MSRGSLTDEDGIDGPFEKRMRKPTKKVAVPRGVYHGPMDVSYVLTWSDSKGSTIVHTLERAVAELAYFRRQGREATPTILRTEICPQPGCNGDGTRSVKRRGAMFSTGVPCVGCQGRHELEEDVARLEPVLTNDEDTLEAVLGWFGFDHRPRTDLPEALGSVGGRVVTRGGWPVFAGSAGSCWEWLREIGKII